MTKVTVTELAGIETLKKWRNRALVTLQFHSDTLAECWVNIPKKPRWWASNV